MRLIECHGEVCPCFLELPFVDLMGISINHRDLIDGGEIYKDLWSFLLQLKRFRVRTNHKVALNALIGDRIEYADRALGIITVSHVYAFGRWVVPKLIRILRIFDAIDQFVSVGVEDFARPIALI